MQKHKLEGLLENIESIRNEDFPLFAKEDRVYLDSAATSQVPLTVLKNAFGYRMKHIRGSNHSNNSLEAERAGSVVEDVRTTVKAFFNASRYHISFNSGTTAASNFVACTFPFTSEDLLILTEAEHHSQMLTARSVAQSAGAKVVYAPIQLPNGNLDLNALDGLVKAHTSGNILLNLIHASNVTGVINPVAEVREILTQDRKGNAYVYLDMAQSAGHLPIDLDQLDVDFAAVSAHKMYGPTGVGGLFVHKRSQNVLTSNVSGGSAIKFVSKRQAIPAPVPARYEPGTQNLDGILEWGFAMDYLLRIGMLAIEKHDQVLTQYVLDRLVEIPSVRVYGPKDNAYKTSVIAFNVGQLQYDDVDKKLNAKGISVRSGCFCAHVHIGRLMGLTDKEHEKMLGRVAIESKARTLGAVRASFAFYNNQQDADRFITAVRSIASE